MNKSTIVSIIAFVFILGGIFFVVKGKNNKVPTYQANPQIQDTNTNSVTSAPKESINPNASNTNSSDVTVNSYKIADVALHANSSSCWTAINGNVYDVTSWISKHPGGSNAILSLCGHDGSDVFNGKHGGQARPESELANFKIGILN